MSGFKGFKNLPIPTSNLVVEFKCPDSEETMTTVLCPEHFAESMRESERARRRPFCKGLVVRPGHGKCKVCEDQEAKDEEAEKKGEK